MEIKYRNDWIDIGHLESVRTYVFDDGQRLSITDPDKLLINDQDEHLILDKHGQEFSIPGNWLLFFSEGTWGIHVASEGVTKAPAEIPELSEDLSQICFYFDSGIKFHIDDPKRMLTKETGSTKLSDDAGRIYYIRPRWHTLQKILRK